MHDPTDNLSAIGRNVLKLNPNAYRELLVKTPGTSESREILAGLTPRDLIAGVVQHQEQADAMLAGLWLWHDFLDESHRIAQGIESETGNFWHAIMHRREGDFSNSKYWYARCRNHPALQTLAVQSAAILNPLPADKSLLRLHMQGWDPAALVDLVEQVYERPEDPRHEVAIALQRLEWRVLFDSCTRAA